jgi:head-tail adaptor
MIIRVKYDHAVRSQAGERMKTYVTNGHDYATTRCEHAKMKIQAIREGYIY